MPHSIKKFFPQMGVESMGFASEGLFLPVPLAYAGVNRPIPPESSYLKRVMVAPGRRRERVFGITGGERSHCFMALPKPPHGYTIDMGAAPDGVELVDLTHFVRVHPNGYRAMALVLLGARGKDTIVYVQGRPHGSSGLQEWRVFIPPRLEICQFPGLAGHSCLLDSEDPQRLLIAGPSGWATVSLNEGGAEVIDRKDDPQADLLPVARGDKGANLWLDRRGRIFAWDWDRAAFLERGEAPLKERQAWQWARMDTQDNLWLSDGSPHLYRWNAAEGLRTMGQAPYAPVQFLVQTADGRHFGFCGDGIGHWFEWSGEESAVRPIGPIASFLVNPRYGFQFNDAAAGRDGALYLAENDRGGHLWIHYPGARPAGD